MNEKSEVLRRFNSLGALTAMRWSGDDAATRALSDLPEAAGYDTAAIGGARHSLLRDRMDRVFSCEKYGLSDTDETHGMDFVLQELSDDAVRTFPRIRPRTFWRANLTGSPGWTEGSYRVLIASAEYGRVHRIRWSERSETKQRVARQALTPGAEETVLDALPDEVLEELYSGSSHVIDLPTLILAHTLNTVTGERELILGRPRDNRDGGEAFLWHHDLMQDSPPASSAGDEPTVQPEGPDAAPDVAVRLRRRAATQGGL